MPQSNLPRRNFLKTTALTAAGALAAPLSARGANSKTPNVILCMSDDQGWGDASYRGHPHLRTPALDAMASGGVRFDRFYSGSAVCSPTRGGCLTGRHPYRYGVFGANKHHLPPEEINLAEVLKERGYRTGHFGKWHLGTLTKTERDSNRGGLPENVQHYSPPWDHGFDVCFSTEAKTPTWDPMIDPITKEPFGTAYWREDGSKETENLEGDDSRIIMDRAVPFIEEAAKSDTPFFAVVWFHTPHYPVVGGPSYLEKFPGLSERERHYYGCLTAMDEQMGRLRQTLRDLGVAEDTLLFFCSDNGPADPVGEPGPGSAGEFRGRKGSLYEGGVRVPGLLEWPRRFPQPAKVETACSVLDYFPTILEALKMEAKGDRPYDGQSLIPFIEGKRTERDGPIGFEHWNQQALIGNRYKIYSGDSGDTFELYDLEKDPSESVNLAAKEPDRLEKMKATLKTWRSSCDRSREGADYR